MLSGPERPNPHSAAKKLDGDGSSASETKRLGNADIGVSMLLLLLYALVFCTVGAVVAGGGGRANGFGGPVAPALWIALAEGEGGGRTTPG